ncbi:sigma-70 family RNA polymerase sigma factor [Actinomycetospora lutea]|uniref:RNA polymerase sigma factor n=1 Tax=Actinomycetospora lutea TaxID=663604 RepID=UPI002366180C|nr:sigma-70 family RNA polymerase sigma factor [Actinomycetospora lutea]MDD7939042.1 sigma-70 family RNA polymerase sigma factor [Actinomycetospora lutea]
MTEPDDGHAALVRVVRDEGRRVLATLIRTVGDWQVAEDAVADAVERALATWPRTGVPEQPRAWLIVTARRCAVDLLRRESRRAEKEASAVEMHLPGDDRDVDTIDDDLLRLVFTCCHPALEPPAQVALALRTLCGLNTEEVARALLVSEATMSKRITRTKQKIARAAIPYRVPAAHELPDRLLTVAATVYFLFNEGYSATSGDAPLRGELAAEAVRLARLVHALLPDEPTAIGLLALLLLQHSRRDARVDAEGRPVLLADQDRDRWHDDEIVEAVALIGRGLRRCPERPDPYLVQAAIAACHALAPSPDTTDWVAVVSWYDVLLTVRDGPVERLNRAVAIGERDGPAAGLAAVDAVENLEDHAPWLASRAVLLARLGRTGEADDAFGLAITAETNAARRDDLRRRRRRLGEPTPT